MFLLVSSLALLVPPPASPDSPSSPLPRLVDVLVQGRGAAAAVAAVGGRSLVALPIIDGLLARVPAEEAPDQLPAGPTPPTTPPRPPATGPTTAHPR